MKPLFTEKKKHGFGIFLFIIICILLASYTIFDNTRLTLTRQPITIPSLPKELEGFTILNVSDLCGKEFGEDQKDLASLINAQKYDALIFTGNLTGHDNSPKAFYTLLERIAKKENIFFIVGDKDPEEYATDPQTEVFGYSEMIREAEARGAVYLDKPEAISREGATLWVFPDLTASINVEDTMVTIEEQIREQSSSSGDPYLLAKARFNKGRYEAIAAAQAQIREGDIQVSVFRMPQHSGTLAGNWVPARGPTPTTSADEEPESTEPGTERRLVQRINLILAGGYMGGPHRLPFLGPIHVEDRTLGLRGWFPPSDRVSGVTDVDGIRQYIPRGLGARVSPKWLSFRLFNTPEISLITLTTNWSDASSPTSR